MKRLLLTLVVFTVIAGLVWVTGCSDDDETSTGSITKPAGDTLDPVFVGARNALSDAMDSIPLGLEAMINGLWGVLSGMSASPLSKPMNALEPDTVWFDTTNDYWYAVEEYTGLVYRYQIDSLQFMQGNTAVQWPDTALLTRINGGMFAVIRQPEVSKIGVNDTIFKYTFVGNISGAPGSIPAYGDVAINGSGKIVSVNFPGKNAAEIYCGYLLDDNYTIANVQLNMVTVFGFDGCPTSGTITHNAALTLACTGDTTFENIDNWYMQQSFANDSTRYVVENSTYRWEITEDCGSDSK